MGIRNFKTGGAALVDGTFSDPDTLNAVFDEAFVGDLAVYT
jgi:hypothetical protein